MKFLVIAALLGSYIIHAQPLLPAKTSFQVSAPWNPAYDLRSDVVMVYGMDSSFPARVHSYKERGYHIQFMTGVAWGNYQDYFEGRFDGKTHEEEGQVQQNGEVIGHGKGVPYIVPSASYINYMKTVVKRAIDGGADAIYLEEPEFWARGGYSEAFKKEWQQYYGFAWIAQHESPEATWLSSRLKYHLYFNALQQLFTYTRAYADSIGKKIQCFVPTHSLLNYASWQIVSPEASLASLKGMDGYIAQVWTGTAREPNYFNGIKKERVFETAYLEYESMLSMTAPAKRTIYFLTDPIEDWPRTWDDYKRNYQATFTAELLFPQVDHFEVMPWPNRIYLGKFKLENNPVPQPISPAYATQVQVMINSLNSIPASANRLNGSKGIGVLLGNSMMFQRFPVHEGYTDPQLSDCYGMILPLFKRGIPVETVHMENLAFAETLRDIKVLVMSYANMKPLSPDVHAHLAGWVAQGGVLVYYGRDKDPFQRVREWWNTGGNSYKAASDHLFRQMGIPLQTGGLLNDSVQQYGFGKGQVYIVRKDPKELVLEPGQDAAFMQLLHKAYEKDAHAGLLQLKNYFLLRRGPYLLGSVLDESVSDSALHLRGNFIDLFDYTLPVIHEKTVLPGQQVYLYDMDAKKETQRPCVLAAASRVYSETSDSKHYSFITKSPSGTQNVMRLLLPAKPVKLSVTTAAGSKTAYEQQWDAASKTLLLQFVNDCNGIKVSLAFGQ